MNVCSNSNFSLNTTSTQDSLATSLQNFKTFTGKNVNNFYSKNVRFSTDQEQDDFFRQLSDKLSMTDIIEFIGKITNNEYLQLDVTVD